METSKLLAVAIDLLEENRSDNSNSMDQLFNAISAGNSDDIKASFERTKSLFNNCISNSYNPSDKDIFYAIKADRYFGKNAFTVIDEILKSHSYDQNGLIQALSIYIKDRQRFIAELAKIESSFEYFNIAQHYRDEDLYEIGFIHKTEDDGIPLNQLQKEFSQLDKIFKNLSELTTGKPEDLKVHLVGQGSLTFFALTALPIAYAITKILSEISKLIVNIYKISESRRELESMKVPAKSLKPLIDHEKEMLRKGLDKISEEVIKEFAIKTIEKERLNEIKVAVNNHVKYLAKVVDNGLIIEIHEPYTADEQSTDTGLKGTDLNDKIKEMQAISDSINSLKGIAGTITKLLPENTPDSQDDSDLAESLNDD